MAHRGRAAPAHRPQEGGPNPLKMAGRQSPSTQWFVWFIHLPKTLRSPGMTHEKLKNTSRITEPNLGPNTTLLAMGLSSIPIAPSPPTTSQEELQFPKQPVSPLEGQ